MSECILKTKEKFVELSGTESTLGLCGPHGPISFFLEIFSKHKRNFLNQLSRDFPGGPVMKNQPLNAGNMGSIPDPGRSHLPWNS